MVILTAIVRKIEQGMFDSISETIKSLHRRHQGLVAHRSRSNRGPPDYALVNYPRNGALLRGVVHHIRRTTSHKGPGEKWLHVQDILQFDETDFSPVPGPECWLMFELKHGPVLFLV